MRVLVNSVPKSGTHLVAKALRLLGVACGEAVFVSSAAVGDLAPGGVEPTIPVGVGMPLAVSAGKLRAKLAGLGEGKIAATHIPYSPEMQGLLESLDVRMLLAIRDPRDVAVSLAFHIGREKSHRLHELFATMTPEERILATIRGVTQKGQTVLESLSRRFRSVLPWIEWPACLMVRFEDLVGPSGGGTIEQQLASLQSICVHLRVAPPHLPGIAGKLFGGGPTFRKGTIAQWRTCFTPAQHAALFEEDPQLLSLLGYCAS